MTKFAIRLLTLMMYATALVVVPMVAPATAATDSTETKKKHKKMNQKSSRIEAPSSNPFPRNMSEDPDRKAAGGGY